MKLILTWGFSIFQRWSFFHSLIWLRRVKRNMPLPLALPTGFIIHTPCMEKRRHMTASRSLRSSVPWSNNNQTSSNTKNRALWILTTSCKLLAPFGSFVSFGSWNYIVSKLKHQCCEKRGEIRSNCNNQKCKSNSSLYFRWMSNFFCATWFRNKCSYTGDILLNSSTKRPYSAGSA